ncbi:hypothetical protein FA95DRAFT_91225 [Auriscalpium vulgare]|uniref:Uncharacterized protein n=1 Tax=Auriscalpium vulgare TaxID=40419 RepID=A0ACB8RNU8_9AGAM|nr:hypothetical protein FA95DRAFT_91225 [Auriscalpium vulgare]
MDYDSCNISRIPRRHTTFFNVAVGRRKGLGLQHEAFRDRLRRCQRVHINSDAPLNCSIGLLRSSSHVVSHLLLVCIPTTLTSLLIQCNALRRGTVQVSTLACREVASAALVKHRLSLVGEWRVRNPVCPTVHFTLTRTMEAAYTTSYRRRSRVPLFPLKSMPYSTQF